MAANANVSDKICLYPAQLVSLFSLVRVLPKGRLSVLVALLAYLQAGTLKSTATRKEIVAVTGLGQRTIYTIIREFEACGLLKQWRGPFQVKQKFYRIHLPVPENVFQFYGGTRIDATFSQVEDMKSDLVQSDSFPEQPISGTEDAKETVMHAEFSTVEESHGSVAAQDSSNITFESIAASSAPKAAQAPPEVSEDPMPSAELSFQDASQEAASDLTEMGAVDSGNSAIDVPDNQDADSESYFSDPRLELLIHQVEQGRKDSTIVFKWLKAQNLLTYWPPDDSYRVEKQLLRQRAQTLDELLSILTAPVRPEYQWFVTTIIELSGDHGYKVENTAAALSFQINMLLDGMLKPARQDRSLWTTESMKAQLRIIIEDWTRLRSWKELSCPINQPPEPALEFFATNRHVWEAARERWIEASEAKMLNLFEIVERDMEIPKPSSQQSF